MTQYEIESQWVEDGLNVEFSFGDIVRVKSGESVGKGGRIVALIVLEPQPTYVIELPDGYSVVAIESDIELIEGNTGAKLTLVRK